MNSTLSRKRSLWGIAAQMQLWRGSQHVGQRPPAAISTSLRRTLWAVNTACLSRSGTHIRRTCSDGTPRRLTMRLSSLLQLLLLLLLLLLLPAAAAAGAVVAIVAAVEPGGTRRSHESAPAVAMTTGAPHLHRAGCTLLHLRRSTAAHRACVVALPLPSMPASRPAARQQKQRLL
jgi:hypothetical protein